MTMTLLTAPAAGVRAVADDVELLDERTVRCGDLAVTAAGERPLTLLHRLVYQRVYLGLPPMAEPVEDRRLAPDREDPTLVAALRRADGGRLRWEGGWRHERTTPRGVVVRAVADGVRAVAAAHEVRPTSPTDAGGRAPGVQAPLSEERARAAREQAPARAAYAPGLEVEVAVPTEHRFVSPGFYLTTGLAGRAAGSVVRWYVNVTADAAPSLLARIVLDLDLLELRYTVKTLNDPAAHPRPDALVLYTRRDDACAVAPVLRTALADLGSTLRPRVPAFTRRLAPGVAVADEPVQGSVPLSFGQHRCLVLVRGVLAAGAGAGPEERWSHVARAWADARLDPALPHLGPGNAELVLPGWPS